MTHAVDLRIGGMTCASCAARIEKKLNRMPGVRATVNFATESAHVVLPEDTAVDAAIATVETTGYTATLPEPPRPPAGDVKSAADGEDEVASWRRRLVVSAILTVPVLLLAMVPPLQFDYWQWLSLTLAAPVVVWGAWPFHRAAWMNLRHGAATMDTLISLGVLAAFGPFRETLRKHAAEAGLTLDEARLDEVCRPERFVKRLSTVFDRLAALT